MSKGVAGFFTKHLEWNLEIFGSEIDFFMEKVYYINNQYKE